MNRLWSMLLLFLTMTSAVRAQQPLITSKTPVDFGILHQWLHSGDPRLIAWAADFARRTHDAKIVAEMPALLEHWAAPQAIGDGDWQAAQRLAVTAVLDTLIQENVQVPIPGIAAVAELFPAQAAILIGRLPLSESGYLLTPSHSYSINLVCPLLHSDELLTKESPLWEGEHASRHCSRTKPSKWKSRVPAKGSPAGDPKLGGARPPTQAGAVCRWHAYPFAGIHLLQADSAAQQVPFARELL